MQRFLFCIGSTKAGASKVSNKNSGQNVLDAFNNQINLAGSDDFKSLAEFITEAINERYLQGCRDQALRPKTWNPLTYPWN